MKRLTIFFIVAMIVLTACSSNTGTDNGNGNENNTDRDLLQDFRSQIEKSEKPSEIKEYLDQLMKEADAKTSDALILEYLDYMEAILPDSVSYNQGELESAGFKYISVEGSLMPIIDYHFIDAYSGQLSQELLDYSSFMALNSDEPWAMDAGIVIPLTDLSDRIALAEQFLTKYPDTVVKAKVRLQYEYYLKSLLGGLDNTPLVLYDTNKIDPIFIDAFDYYLETYPDLITSETVQSLQSELKQSNYTAPYTYDDYEKKSAFQTHIDELVADAISKLSQ